MCWLALFLFSRFLPAKQVEINHFYSRQPLQERRISMLKVFATQVVVSKGYEGAPALTFSEKGNFVRFRVGKKKYDPRAENNTRWVNLSVKAFDSMCERIKKMQLKEGSYVNLIGRLDEDSWVDQKTNESKSMMVIILDDIEYASGGGKSKEGQASGQQQKPAPQNTSAPMPAAENPGNFTGYEPFGGGSFFDEN